MAAKTTNFKEEIKERGLKLANEFAKCSAVYAFRNGPIENIHASGRISDEEMEKINRYMVNRLGEIFFLLSTGRGKDLDALLLFPEICSSDWADADLSELEDNVQIGKMFAQNCEFASVSQQPKTQKEQHS